MNGRILLVLAGTICTLGLAPTAQERASISGKVVDAQTGATLQLANVLFVGTSMSATTGRDGTYKMEGVPPGTYSVRISRIGYTSSVITSLYVTVAGPNVANIRLTVAPLIFPCCHGQPLSNPGVGSRAPFSTAVLRADEFGTLQLVIPKPY